MKKAEDTQEDGEAMPVVILKKTASTILGGCFLPFFVLNRSSFWIQRSFIFLHAARWPFVPSLDKTEKYGIKGIKNFYLTTKDNVKVGVWQILPASLINGDGNSPESFEEALSDGKPIIVYVHGNSGTRATPHRLQLYKRLQKQDWHLVTFDYRSYGDSSAVLPDEVGVVEDTKTVIQWVLSKKKSSPVFVWGHSLGTGISSRGVAELEKMGEVVDGLILEAPFNCLEDAVKSHPLSLAFKNMVGFDYFMVQPLINNGLTFKTQEYLASSGIPVLILHGEDDWIVPFILGKKLYQYLLKNRTDAKEQVKFVEFGLKNGGYGHKYICDCPVLMQIVSSFTKGELEKIPSNVD